MFKKKIIAHSQLQRDLLMSMNFKAMNDTLGPEGSVPLAMEFVEFSQIRYAWDVTVPRPKLAERAIAARKSP